VAAAHTVFQRLVIGDGAVEGDQVVVGPTVFGVALDKGLVARMVRRKGKSLLVAVDIDFTTTSFMYSYRHRSEKDFPR
jgi:hypothetical protein